MGGIIQAIGTAFMSGDKFQDDANSIIRQTEFDRAAETYNAQQTERKGSLDAAKVRMEGSQMIARQKTAYANSGVTTDSGGTPLEVMGNTRALTELDAERIKNDAARQAWGYRLQRDQTNANENPKLAGAKRQQTGSILGAVGAFGGGAASAGSMFGGGGGS